LSNQGGVQYSKIAEIKGPLVIVDGVDNAAFDELVEIETTEGERRLGKVLEVGNGKAVVQSLKEQQVFLYLEQMQNLLEKLWKCLYQTKYLEEFLMV